MYKSSNIAIILCGPSGSGKSTYVANFLSRYRDFMVVSPDALRLELTGDMADQSRNAFIFNTLLPIRINGVRAQGKGVIVDATSTTRKARALLIEYAKVAGYSQIECHVIRADEAECQARNAVRDRVVPASVISRQFAQWQEPELTEGFDEIVIIDNHS